MTNPNKRVNVFLAISGRYSISSDISCTSEQAAQIEARIDSLSGYELDEYVRDIMDRYGLHISYGEVEELEIDEFEIDGGDEEDFEDDEDEGATL